MPAQYIRSVYIEPMTPERSHSDPARTADRSVSLPFAELRSSREKGSRFALLGMLSLGERKSGYDLKKALASSTAQFWSESYGNIYPALRKLLAEGLIEEKNEGASAIGRRRRLYSITAQGRQALAEWLRKPVDLRPEDNEFLLKLFFSMLIPAKETLTLVEAHRNYHMRLQADFEAIERRITQGSASEHQKVYFQATLAYGQAVSQAIIEWADATTKDLQALRP